MNSIIKKTLSILLLAALLSAAFAAAGCSKYKRHTLSYFSAGFTWELTPEQAKEYLDETNSAGETAVIEKNNDGVTVATTRTIFRFDAEGKMYAAISILGQPNGAVEMISSWFGRYDKKNRDPESYIWYGKMSEHNAKATLRMEDGNWMIEFNPED